MEILLIEVRTEFLFRPLIQSTLRIPDFIFDHFLHIVQIRDRLFLSSSEVVFCDQETHFHIESPGDPDDPPFLEDFLWIPIRNPWEEEFEKETTEDLHEEERRSIEILCRTPSEERFPCGILTQSLHPEILFRVCDVEDPERDPQGV